MELSQCCENGQTIKVITDYIIPGILDEFFTILRAKVIQGGSTIESDIYSRTEQDMQYSTSLRQYKINVSFSSIEN